MFSLLICVFVYTGIAWCLFSLIVGTIFLLTHPLSNLECNVRIRWLDYYPFHDAVRCISKLQYLIAVSENTLTLPSLEIWFFLSCVVFVVVVIFVSLTYQPDQPPHRF
ncbi:hypothetical protein ABIF99_000439 [Bradyrhizobium japonicum]|nr:hypothetical protein [Bradyrhizobium japonicum]MCP1865132.1 hypothetical protein [Bradyrhizobium japonicum]MCP1896095.1 hypothetical protein [Bradyrhizobium japonicum]MCW2329481.1 hypothetical protein [Bradyrhizobium japonicum]